jgi:xylulokinase
MLNNRTVHSHIHNIDLNKHGNAHLFRAAQEGIAYAFRYGLDIMRENGMNPRVIRAGRANMFLSNLFTSSFANTLNVPVEMYETNGSIGAAIGAGLGAKIYACPQEAFRHFKPVGLVEPTDHALHNDQYGHWLEQLHKQLN